MPKRTHPNVVFVEWEDANYVNGVQRSGEFDPSLVLQEVGFIMKGDRKWLSFSKEYQEDNDTHRHITNIPRKNILSCKVIKKAR